MKLLTPSEVAELLRVKPSTVIRRAPEFGGFKVGKAWRFRAEDVERYIKAQAGGRAA